MRRAEDRLYLSAARLPQIRFITLHPSEPPQGTGAFPKASNARLCKPKVYSVGSVKNAVASAFVVRAPTQSGR
jgi:hypothetical protein